MLSHTRTPSSIAGRAGHRRHAQRWFTDPGLSPVSTTYDQRETMISACVALSVGISELGRTPDRVLDVGCGGGTMLEIAAKQLPDSALFGLDPHRPSIEAARTRLADTGAELFALAAGELPGSAAAARIGQADLVLVHLCLGLWTDPVTELAAVLDLLAPGGLCYVVDLIRPAALDPATLDPFLAAAATEAERDYLRDQVTASLSATEAAELAEQLTAVAGVTAEIRTGDFNGFATGDPATAIALHLLLRRSAGPA
ncbi:hypothetical protein GCM10010452_73870 [Crossiella cryophila]